MCIICVYIDRLELLRYLLKPVLKKSSIGTGKCKNSKIPKSPPKYGAHESHHIRNLTPPDASLNPPPLSVTEAFFSRNCVICLGLKLISLWVKMRKKTSETVREVGETPESLGDSRTFEGFLCQAWTTISKLENLFARMMGSKWPIVGRLTVARQATV